MTVVETVTNPHAEITVEEARTRLNVKANLGDVVEDRLSDREMDRMSRIAAQTAKQVVVQRIREAERDKVFDEFDQRKGEIMTGTIYRREGRNVIVNLGKIEAILPDKEQVESENYRHNERFRFLVLDVRKGPKGPPPSKQGEARRRLWTAGLCRSTTAAHPRTDFALHDGLTDLCGQAYL